MKKKCSECAGLINIDANNLCDEGTFSCTCCGTRLEVSILNSAIFTLIQTGFIVFFANLGIHWVTALLVSFAILRQLALTKFDLFFLPVSTVGRE